MSTNPVPPSPNLGMRQHTPTMGPSLSPSSGGVAPPLGGSSSAAAAGAFTRASAVGAGGRKNIKYLLVCGGVCSSLGKGVTTSIIGALLRGLGFRISALKIDPYINPDAGLMSPFEHGETFVTKDGAELDLDLGNYERWIGLKLSADHNITTGKVYRDLIDKERKGDFLGKTVQVVPHFTNYVQDHIKRVAQIPTDNTDERPDICLIELGGTVGDIESAPFIEALRQLRFSLPPEDFSVALVTYLPNMSGQKTKPTQHSAKTLMSLGILADYLFCRCSEPLHDDARNKLSQLVGIKPKYIFSAHNVGNLYEIPVLFHAQHVVEAVLHKFHLAPRRYDTPAGNISLSRNALFPSAPIDAVEQKEKQLREGSVDSTGSSGSAMPPSLNLSFPSVQDWASFAHRLNNPSKTVKIAFVGKYVGGGSDAYFSVMQAFEHCCLQLQVKLDIQMLDPTVLELPPKGSGKEPSEETLRVRDMITKMDGIFVPGGFGLRAFHGKCEAAGIARRSKVPFFGVCYGFQAALVDIGRSELGLEGATSEEVDVDKESKHHVIRYMPDIDRAVMGATMRLGGKPAFISEPAPTAARAGLVASKPSLEKQSLLSKIYGGVDAVVERHRHRYEFNRKYLQQFQDFGVRFTAASDPLYGDDVRVEALELAAEEHPHFLAAIVVPVSVPVLAHANAALANAPERRANVVPAGALHLRRVHDRYRQVVHGGARRVLALDVASVRARPSTVNAAAAAGFSLLLLIHHRRRLKPATNTALRFRLRARRFRARAALLAHGLAVPLLERHERRHVVRRVAGAEAKVEAPRVVVHEGAQQVDEAAEGGELLLELGHLLEERQPVIGPRQEPLPAREVGVAGVVARQPRLLGLVRSSRITLLLFVVVFLVALLLLRAVVALLVVDAAAAAAAGVAHRRQLVGVLRRSLLLFAVLLDCVEAPLLLLREFLLPLAAVRAQFALRVGVLLPRVLAHARRQLAHRRRDNRKRHVAEQRDDNRDDDGDDNRDGASLFNGFHEECERRKEVNLEGEVRVGGPNDERVHNKVVSRRVVRHGDGLHDAGRLALGQRQKRIDGAQQMEVGEVAEVVHARHLVARPEAALRQRPREVAALVGDAVRVGHDSSVVVDEECACFRPADEVVEEAVRKVVQHHEGAAVGVRHRALARARVRAEHHHRRRVHEAVGVRVGDGRARVVGRHVDRARAVEAVLVGVVPEAAPDEGRPRDGKRARHGRVDALGSRHVVVELLDGDHAVTDGVADVHAGAAVVYFERREVVADRGAQHRRILVTAHERARDGVEVADLGAAANEQREEGVAQRLPARVHGWDRVAQRRVDERHDGPVRAVERVVERDLRVAHLDGADLDDELVDVAVRERDERARDDGDDGDEQHEADDGDEGAEGRLPGGGSAAAA